MSIKIPCKGGGGGSGDVVGPASSVDNDIAVFDGVTGKLLKDSGVNINDIAEGDVQASGAFVEDSITKVDDTGMIQTTTGMTSPAANRISSDVSNLHSYNTVKSSDVGSSTCAIVEGADGIILAIERTQHTVRAYRRAKNGLLTLVDTLTDAVQLNGAIDGRSDSQYFYIVCIDSERVTKIDYSPLAENKSMVIVNSVVLGNSPLGIAIDTRGYLYVGYILGTQGFKIFDSNLTLISSFAGNSGNGLDVGQDDSGNFFLALAATTGIVDLFNVTDVNNIALLTGSYSNSNIYTQGRAVNLDTSKNKIYIASLSSNKILITLKYIIDYDSNSVSFNDDTRIDNDFFDRVTSMKRKGDLLYFNCMRGVGDNLNVGGVAVMNVRGNPYASGYMTTKPTGDFETFQSAPVSEFRLPIDGIFENVSGLIFTAVTNLYDVAAILQSGVRSSGTTEGFINATVVATSNDATNRFIFTSGTTGASSSVGVLVAADPATENPIQGSAYLNGAAGLVTNTDDPILAEKYTPSSNYDDTIEMAFPIGNQLYMANDFSVDTLAWADITQLEFSKISTGYINATNADVDELRIVKLTQNNNPISFVESAGNVGVRSRHTGLLDMSAAPTIISPTQINIPAGSGLIVNTSNPDSISEQYVSWAEINYTVTGIATPEVYKIFCDTDGVFGQKTVNSFTSTDARDFIVICSVLGDSNVIVEIKPTPDQISYSTALSEDLFNFTIGMAKNGIFTYNENNDLSVRVTNGRLFKPNIGFHLNKQAPNWIPFTAPVPAADIQFIRVLRRSDPTDMMTSDGVLYTTLDVSQYDDGTEILKSVGNSEWTVQVLFISDAINPITGTFGYFLAYGQKIYTTQAEAVADTANLSFTAKGSLRSICQIGYYVVKGNENNLNSSTANIIHAPKSQNSDWSFTP